MDGRPALRGGGLLLGLLALAGCRSEAPRGEVEGTVRCDGRPLVNVLVTFLPDADSGASGGRSSAVTDAQGRYQLRGEDGRRGTVAGWYRVIVEDMAVYAAPRDREGSLLRRPPARFPPRYGDPLQTPLRKEVQGESQTIDLNLAAAP
jgi:hypothetical protein